MDWSGKNKTQIAYQHKEQQEVISPYTLDMK